MEDVLEVYHRPPDPACPGVCGDEPSKQLSVETRKPIPAKPGRPARYDYEYERNGTANLLMMFAPLEGWRKVKLTDRHAALDYAQGKRGKSPGTQVQHTLAIRTMDTEFRHFLASNYGTIWPNTKSARGFAPITAQV